MRLRSGEGLECRTRSAVLRSPDRRANAFEKLILVASPPVAGYAPNTMSQAASAACSAIARVRLGSRDLSGCVLVSTSRPCRMCEAAAGWVRIARMVHGDALTDAGPPS